MKLIKTISVFFSALLLCSCTPESIRIAQPVINTMAPAELQYQWLLIGIDEQPINIRIRSELTISSENKATGNLACNYFFGTMQLQNERLKIDNMGKTRQRCDIQIDQVETMVSGVLSNWSEVSLNDNKLTLIGKSHRLNYKRKE